MNVEENKINYYVLGGQHFWKNYGGVKTLHSAKLLATKHEEYWDNWRAWRKPLIYRAEDCELCKAGVEEYIVPKGGTEPVARWDEYTSRWEVG